MRKLRMEIFADMSTGSGWAEAFLEMMAVERAAAKNTLTAYAKDLTDTLGFLSVRQRDFAKASPEDIEAYFSALGDRGLSPATAASSIALCWAKAGGVTILRDVWTLRNRVAHCPRCCRVMRSIASSRLRRRAMGLRACD
jgi:hypothetical protein